MRQREIYIADLEPVKGSEQRGKRPVVIISGNTMNDNIDMVIICPLTSVIKNYSGCVIIEKNFTNNLEKDSEIITFQVRTVSKVRLSKKIGEITPGQLNKIISGLNDMLKY